MCTNDELSDQIKSLSEKLTHTLEQVNYKLDTADRERKDLDVKTDEIIAWQNQIKGGSRVVLSIAAAVGALSAFALGWLEFFKK